MAQAPISKAPGSLVPGEIGTGIARLLGHRFGDGLVYFRDESERRLFTLAVEQGLINREGYLTPEGHSFLAIYGGG